MLRFVPIFLALRASAPAADFFAGASGGISTLSADAVTNGSPPSAFAAYKPENGATFQLFAGRHLSDWFSVQGSYGWNRNQVKLSASGPGGAYDFPATVSMHTAVVDAVMYFRPRQSRLRPYLSAGSGVMRFAGSQSDRAAISGTPPLPPAKWSRTGVPLRVAVGIDIVVAHPILFRYSFGETIQSNALSSQLTPRGERRLANFQNLWGIAWRF